MEDEVSQKLNHLANRLDSGLFSAEVENNYRVRGSLEETTERDLTPSAIFQFLEDDEEINPDPDSELERTEAEEILLTPGGRIDLEWSSTLPSYAYGGIISSVEATNQEIVLSDNTVVEELTAPLIDSTIEELEDDINERREAALNEILEEIS